VVGILAHPKIGLNVVSVGLVSTCAHKVACGGRSHLSNYLGSSCLISPKASSLLDSLPRPFPGRLLCASRKGAQLHLHYNKNLHLIICEYLDGFTGQRHAECVHSSSCLISRLAAKLTVTASRHHIAAINTINDKRAMEHKQISTRIDDSKVK
jgi:hypothetical protein